MSVNLDTIIGALLVGTWVLYAVEVIQAVYYYRHFKHDSWKLKLLVSSAIAIDSVSMIANYASVYLVTQSLTGEIWPICRISIGQPYPLYLFTTSIVAALAQSFLVFKYWRLTKNKFITLILFFFITVAIGGGFASAVMLAIFPEYKNRQKAIIPATTWLITEAVTDISIALALLLEFRRIKSSFEKTRSLLDRLVKRTIQTGAAGATIAVAVFIAFLTSKETNVPSGIAYCLGRVYCLTMLANLNARQTENTRISKGTSSGANLGTRGERGNQARSADGDDYGGIHVHRTAVVHIETPQEFSIGSFKTNGLPDDRPAVETEMAVNNSASYPSENKKDPFVA
ncbi:hypothetical protein C8R44DRAFT_892425 [Mycena epipterygia]|nr:hypothetical protein C8R44DRAFT_892425 [Mycena epipterygia]